LRSALVFVVALVWLGAGVQDAGIASAYADPVSRIGAQDEAVYFREAIEMAQGGNWLTPTYLGRYVLNKPPLTQWLTAISLRAFGISAWSARLPSLLAAALIVVLLITWMSSLWGWPVALGGVLLLSSSHLYYVFARLCVTDMLLTLWIVTAMFVLARDPSLTRIRSALLFGAAVGAGVMTKGAAGLLPLFAFALIAAFATRGARPTLARVALALSAAAVVSLPWHLYQLAVHPRWFIAEYILTQHLSIGVTAPPQYSDENQLLFYLRRIVVMDPVLALAAGAGLVLALSEWRRHMVLLAWLAAVTAALIGFRYRSAYYLLPLLPAFAMLAAVAFTRIPRRAIGAACALVLAAGAVKTSYASTAWGLPALQATQLSEAASLERYCARNRGNDLILVDPGDEFYSSDLPLRRVRYCLLDRKTASTHTRRPLDFDYLGIALSTEEFNRGHAATAVYAERLAAFDMPSAESVGTVIWASSQAELETLIAAHPEADFFVRQELHRRLPPSPAHDAVTAGGGRVLLLSRMAKAHRPDWACEL
jgi:hypothetical protein